MEIFLTPHFKRLIKKLPIRFRPLIERRVALFQLNPFHPTLKTHKLSGDLDGRWSFSIDYKHRIIFRFVGHEKVTFLAIGDHSIYN